MMTPATREQLIDVCARLRDEYPVIGGGLVDRHLAADEPAWEYAQRALGYVASRSQDDLKTELEAFATVSMDFLRLQARFMRTRQYARAGGAAGLVEELYNDESKMKGYYLDGLALTYALWPNHSRMITFMAQSFIPRLQPGDRVAEVGVGHGLLAALMFDAVPDLQYVGVDISQSSLDYAGAALLGAGVDPARVSMVHADAMSGDLVRLGGEQGFDALVCCEVVEHVDNPDTMLAALAEALAPTKPGFVSTVANMEADDHVYLYNDVDEIRAMLTDTGWSVVDDLANALPGGEEWDPLPVNYCAVVTPSRSAS
ncbi:MAG TPA: class I SAM-dependent methyltransferase [Mycobacteriales bacterium]|jgi:2-polyprenyl-3-methyl-5-hydroxy-6-metoxy-1,4-benzoquinol methylase|nr:class I SAM-dependent methyltransferase [Mycobacteriales bacterium]